MFWIFFSCRDVSRWRKNKWRQLFSPFEFSACSASVKRKFKFVSSSCCCCCCFQLLVRQDENKCFNIFKMWNDFRKLSLVSSRLGGSRFVSTWSRLRTLISTFQQRYLDSFKKQVLTFQQGHLDSFKKLISAFQQRYLDSFKK